MKVAVAAEVEAGEPRIAATPETIKKIIGLGAEVAVEPGAGIKSGILDADYSAAGAKISPDALNGADIILKVRRPQAAELSRYKRGAIVIGIIDPYGHDDALRDDRCRSHIVRHGAPAAHHPRASDGRSLEPGQSRRLPRRDRRRRRVWPRAADDDDCGRHGAGHQGLCHGRRRRRPAGDRDRAAARRGGHRDRRAAGGERAGGKPRRQIRRGRGRRNSRRRKPQAATPKKCPRNTKPSRRLWSPIIKKQDIVITTALIPGRPAPRLISKEMVASMRPGSVIVDLAVERGGNVEGVKADTVTETGAAKIVGYSNVPGGSRPRRQAFMRRRSTPAGRADRQKDQRAGDQLGRRYRESDRAHARRRSRPSEFQAEERGVGL